ncbi:MAG: hypothetical protein JXR44_04995 [Thiotrichales bacterium]|nr:hypothetical protein [Thiotrichales bacterium]
MFIKIRYEAAWRNSFLDRSNNEPIPKGGRKFIASMKELKKEGNYKTRQISKDTVMGVLNRLIGDQRKLYQARNSENYYFREIENVLTEECIKDMPENTQELVYIRNITGSTDQNSFTGMIKTQDAAFNSAFSSQIWGILFLDFPNLLEFCLNPKIGANTEVELDPIAVISQLEEINSLKPVELDEKCQEVLNLLKLKYPDVDYKLTAKGQMPPITFYASALYIQLEELAKVFDLSNVVTKSGGLSGISKRGFTKKDFMDRYTTGNKKIIFGNPYLLKQRIPGEGEVTKLLTKASGLLEIDLKISREQAQDLQEKIDCAGVSSFYLGKKGLAYIEDIRI